jgi:hypothetical protein
LKRGIIFLLFPCRRRIKKDAAKEKEGKKTEKESE